MIHNTVYVLIFACIKFRKFGITDWFAYTLMVAYFERGHSPDSAEKKNFEDRTNRTRDKCIQSLLSYQRFSTIVVLYSPGG